MTQGRVKAWKWAKIKMTPERKTTRTGSVQGEVAGGGAPGVGLDVLFKDAKDLVTFGPDNLKGPHIVPQIFRYQG
jgi:hypothetical protein